MTLPLPLLPQLPETVPIESRNMASVSVYDDGTNTVRIGITSGKMEIQIVQGDSSQNIQPLNIDGVVHIIPFNAVKMLITAGIDNMVSIVFKNYDEQVSGYNGPGVITMTRRSLIRAWYLNNRIHKLCIYCFDSNESIWKYCNDVDGEIREGF